MSAAPIFFITPRVAGVTSPLSANNIKAVGSANNLASVVTGAAAPGSIIQRVVVEQNAAYAAASTANNQCRFYLVSGGLFYLIHEFNMGGAVTPSATAVGFRFLVPELVGVKLPSAGWSLQVGFSAVAAGDSCTITAEVADA